MKIEKLFKYKLDEEHTLFLLKFGQNMGIYRRKNNSTWPLEKINLFNPYPITEYELLNKLNEWAGAEVFRLIDSTVRIDNDGLIEIETEASIWIDVDNVAHYIVSNKKGKIIDYVNTNQLSGEELYQRFMTFARQEFEWTELYKYIEEALKAINGGYSGA